MKKKQNIHGQVETLEKNQRKVSNHIKGITLIALVITIVVLIILAGISINLVLGENGLFNKARQAVEETKKASEEEQRKLAMLEAAANLENTTYKGVTIPAGFAPTKIEGEDTVKDGLVIIDKNGNEFVWIPVTTNYERNNSFNDSNIAQKDNGYLPDGIVVDGEDEESKEKEIVSNARGFYIGRYEAGAEGGILQKDETDSNYSWVETPKLVCKKGATVYNNISQPEAEKVAKTFINNNNVKSGLITGIQWDLTLEFINEKIDGEGQIYKVEEASPSRHTTIIAAPSGQNEADRVCNIYDLEGNLKEYTAERVVTQDRKNKRSSVERGRPLEC